MHSDQRSRSQPEQAANLNAQETDNAPGAVMHTDLEVERASVGQSIICAA